MMIISRNVALAPLTTLGLGGPASEFAECTTVGDLREAVQSTVVRILPLHVLGGGSNTIVPDEGVDGLVVRIGLRGVTMTDDDDAVLVDAAAGEPWDDLVFRCVEHGLGGIECLSGIPGLVGATPIQNVGAYGQEVSQTIVRVHTLDRATLEERLFHGSDCGFRYRESRFKGRDAGRFLVTGVTFRLRKDAAPEVRYAELQRSLESTGGMDPQARGRAALTRVRDAVLAIRRAKSMIVDPNDPESRSAGSFFLNPLLSAGEAQRVQAAWASGGGTDPVPLYPADEGLKIPAAWLVEQAGFGTGYRRGGVGLSSHHALALVNHGGTARELLALADDIRAAVLRRFGVRLEREPVLLGEER